MSIADNRLQDWLGTEICPGCTVIYPINKGSALYMIHAEVLEIGHKADNWMSDPDAWYVKVQPDKSSWMGYGIAKHPVTLRSIDRITVIGCPL